MSTPESLTDDAGPKTTECRRVGEVGVAAIGELSLLEIGEKTLRQSSGLFRGQTRSIRPDRLKVPCNRQSGGALTPR